VPNQRAGTDRSPSETEWLRVNDYLKRYRYELAVRAAKGYPGDASVAGTPLLAAPAWLPPRPVPLEEVSLTFSPAAPVPRCTDIAGIAPALFPERSSGLSYRHHSEAMRDLAAPAIFENRTLYRLTGADLAGEHPQLAFTLGRFFDGVDIGGAAAHEYAAAELGLADGLPLRAAIKDPCDLTARSATMAVGALTLRFDRATGMASFPLHYRDPARVSHAGGMFQVIPVGIFQPSGEAPWNVDNDFSLWRGLLREYAEELLGAGEDHGSERAPIDYANWPLAARMTEALADGRIRAWCLGLGTDPLTFAMDLLTVVVIDAPLYDELFSGIVTENGEGTVLASRPFDEATVSELISGHPVQAAGAALLRLAIASKDVLLGQLRCWARYQPRSAHSRRCGRSAPTVVSRPWPEYTQFASGSRSDKGWLSSLKRDGRRGQGRGRGGGAVPDVEWLAALGAGHAVRPAVHTWHRRRTWRGRNVSGAIRPDVIPAGGGRGPALR
jgi:hypothetical protein